VNKDEIKGAAEKVGGKIKEKAGKITGKRDLEQKGRTEQANGQVRENVGRIKEQGKNS
jgi:uncharacterized protein YjbJ (UPF0337 family)